MKIGIPKEVKKQEYRIALTPQAVENLVRGGHTVFVEKSAGKGALFSDSDYEKAGAKLVNLHGELFALSELIVKVKEPMPEEIKLLTENHVLFAYLHLASSKDLTVGLLDSKVTAISFETVETDDGKRPLLAPMSEIAGRLATLEGAKYLQRPHGGVGKLLATFEEGEVAPNVVVIGIGVSGTASARTALALGANVTAVDTNLEKLKEIKSLLGEKVKTLESTPENIQELLKDADLVVGAVLRTGDRAPIVIKKEYLKLMKKGAVIVDIAIDQGGCVETSKPTTHSRPVFKVKGIIHYCVANMPGCVPVTSTIAISNAIEKYVKEIADLGWKESLRRNSVLRKGLNIYRGKVTYEPVAKLFDLPYMSPQDAIND